MKKVQKFKVGNKNEEKQETIKMDKNVPFDSLKCNHFNYY